MHKLATLLIRMYTQYIDSTLISERKYISHNTMQKIYTT